MRDEPGFTVAIAFIGVLIGVACMAFGGWIMHSAVNSKAIERGYALYHPTTGKFVWKCDYELEKTK
jgi:hypothetical protein